MHFITPPNARDLLPPLLACLPTAFFSPHPPPALLPLLSPILRQRVNLLSSSRSSNNHNNNTTPQANNQNNTTWLPLLTWNPHLAPQLLETVSRLQLEPHPVSGELELFPEDGDDQIWYRRLDSETLQARCEVREFGLAVVWVWCVNDAGVEGQGEGSGWRVAEVLPLEDEDGARFDEGAREGWFVSMNGAEEDAARRREVLEGDAAREQEQTRRVSVGVSAGDEDDDDYWASYDQTPGGQTPAPQRSPAPGSVVGAAGRKNGRTEEEEYYARYGEEVQPAMDGHDPDEEVASGQYESTLGGGGASNWQDSHQSGVSATEYASFMGGVDGASRFGRERSETNATEVPRATQRIHSPQPERPASSGSGSSSNSVAALEAKVSSAAAAENGVKRHIGMEIKSLFRLAQGVGLEKEEFERLVRTELECLSLIEL